MLSPAVRDELYESVEGIEDDVPLGFLNHPSFDDAVYCIPGLAVEFREVIHRPIYLHVFNKHPVSRLCLLHGATVQSLVVVAEDRADLFLDVDIIFHVQRAACTL